MPSPATPAAKTGEHRWAVVAIAVLDASQAAELHGVDLMDRYERVCELLAMGQLDQVRGPICTECRVHWRDVHGVGSQPWPCPGRRPSGLGGPLAPPDPVDSRQVRRRRAREAARAAR